MNAVLDNFAGNKVELKVDAFDETRLMDNLQKIANRIALGLVLAALIVGAALMMQVQTPASASSATRASPCCSSCWRRRAGSCSSSPSSSTTTGGSGGGSGRPSPPRPSSPVPSLPPHRERRENSKIASASFPFPGEGGWEGTGEGQG